MKSLAILLLSLSACSGCTGTLNQPSRVNTVLIGSTFTPAERAVIKQSLRDWETASDGRLMFVEGPVAPGLGHIDILKGNPPPGDTGWNHREGMVVTVTILEGMTVEHVRCTSLHETGHAIGLRYRNAVDDHHYMGDQPSIMRRTIEEAATEIQPVDVDALREVLK